MEAMPIADFSLAVLIFARGNIARTKLIISYGKEKKEAFKERDEGKKQVPPLFFSDYKSGEKD